MPSFEDFEVILHTLDDGDPHYDVLSCENFPALDPDFDNDN